MKGIKKEDLDTASIEFQYAKEYEEAKKAVLNNASVCVSNKLFYGDILLIEAKADDGICHNVWVSNIIGELKEELEIYKIAFNNLTEKWVKDKVKLELENAKIQKEELDYQRYEKFLNGEE